MERNRRWTGPDIKLNVFRAGIITNFGREAGTFLKIPIRACFGRRDTKAAAAPGNYHFGRGGDSAGGRESEIAVATKS